MMNINQISVCIGVVLIITFIVKIVKKSSKWDLLHSIKRRFNYYKTPSGNWVLLDREKESVLIIDDECVEEFMKPRIITDYEDVKFKYLKMKLTEKFYNDYLNKIKYKQGVRLYQKKLNGTNS